MADATSQARGPGNPLENLTALVADDLTAVNALIVARMQSSVALIPQLAGYLIGAGGKRLRPVLTLAAARLCGYAGERHVALATAVEFIHTATLLHDDVVDESDLRRGTPSANAVFGNKASVLVGDFLFSRAFMMLVADGSLDVLAIMSSASAVLAEGEVLQLQTANDTETTEQAYLEVVRSKTAILFAAACELGAVVAGRPQAEQAALHAYGLNLGMAFQLVDDVLDYSAHQAKLGKAVGDDFREGKITLPVVLALADADAEEMAFWKRTLEALEQEEADLEQAIALLNRRQTLAATIAKAREFVETARTALQAFPASPMREALLAVLDFVVDREY